MAMLLTPTQEHFQPWSFEKASNYKFESHSSEVSSTIFFDAEERIRIDSTMEDIQAALTERTQAGFDEAYQSSEEALSPMLQDDPAEEDADDEDMAEEVSEDESSWTDLGSFTIDIAVAICVAAAGKAKVINLPQRWAALRRNLDYHPSRSSSAAPSITGRSASRTPVPRLNTNVPAPALSAPQTADSSRSTSSQSMYSSLSTKSNGSLHRIAPSDASATSWAASTSDHSSYSVTASFLDSDPYENTQPKSTGRSRLRSISARFISSSISPSTDEPSERSPSKEVKQKRRRSLIQAARPEATPFFFSQRARDEWHREQAQLQRSSTPPVRSSTPTQQKKFPKMVARGANEREPTLELPPCPGDYDQELPALNPYAMPNPRASSVQIGRRRSLRLYG